jgi:hypothetical protein
MLQLPALDSSSEQAASSRTGNDVERNSEAHHSEAGQIGAEENRGQGSRLTSPKRLRDALAVSPPGALCASRTRLKTD